MNDVRFDRRAFLASGAALSATLLLPGSARAQSLDASIAIDASRPSHRVPANFMGLSFEASNVTGSQYFSAQNDELIGFVRGLGPGVLRIGGKSVDRIVYAVDDLRNLAAFSRATGWPVLLGLNLGASNPPEAVGQAEDAARALGDRLLAFEIGNEPERYAANGTRASDYGYRAYLDEFVTFSTAIRSRVRNARFAGPSVTANTDDWTVPFAHDARTHIALLTAGYDRMGAPADSSVTIDRLLHGHDDDRLEHTLSSLRDAALAARTPYRLAACRPTSGDGKSGVTDTFAAALWGLDFAHRVGAAAGAGINVAAGGTGANTPLFERPDGNGNFSSRPLYYGLQFFAPSAGARIVPLQLGGSHPNVRAYAVRRDDGSILVTVVNPDARDAAAVSISGTGLDTATVRTLTASSLRAKSGVSISAPSPAQGNPIAVAPGSASLITLTR
ncbi:MAG TPA: hypothetical protein VIG32_06885 [Candidatus Baltobacteraceae bacterium]